MNIFSKVTRISLSTAFFTMLGSAAIADDTEIFFTDVDAVVKPNVMLVLDASGSMTSNKIGDETRLAVMQEATKNLLDSVSDANVGLMFFGGNDGAYFKAPIKPMDDAHRTFLKNKVDEMSGGGNTPLSESLFEAMRYYQGEDIFIRDKDGGDYVAWPDYARLPQSDVDGVSSGGSFISPIKYECQPNNVVLLTDGEPTSDTNYKSTIESEIGTTCSGNCLDEIADYMWSGDMHTGFSGDQKIVTHTVGFQTSQTLLENTASNGNGSYVQANDASSLEDAFSELFDQVLAQSTTFSAPGIAVNTFDRLNHLDSLYFAVFQPAATPQWAGNLKRYKLGVNVDADGNRQAVILDQDGDEAVDPSTGFFKDGARSWWSPSADGKNVKEGGAASQHDTYHANREVYTYLGSDTDLTDEDNEISVANIGNLSKTLLGDAAMSDDDHKDLINWIRGADIDGEDPARSRKFVSDPLHSVPHLIVYGGTEASPDTAIYFGDNQGFIHGINGSSGETYFSFMPEKFLANQAVLMGGSTSEPKRYGMDGKVTSWVYDDNSDGEISGANDHAYIYAGMRRGGKGYYALDVTNPASPGLLWKIQGGVDGSDFEELAQTWSTPAKSKIKINNKIYDVLVFGGGYDTNQDTVEERKEATRDTSGRALYIVDAETGDLLWWAGPKDSGADLEIDEMHYSVPSAPKILDVTGNGWIDQIYIGDMGGQLFRFDVVNGAKKAEDLVTGGRIADFAEDNDPAETRRFYHAPDLFGMKVGGKRYLGLIIGSGYQAHPLNETIEDRIYMMRMPDVTAPPLDADGDPSYTAITEADLYDATDNLIQQGTETERSDAADALRDSKGWFIRLERDGEKVLSTSQTINNEVFITTYEPTPSENPCTPAAGTSRLYHISAADGRAVRNYYTADNSDDENLTSEDREKELSTIGLPPDAQRMRVDDTDIVCVGAECMTVDSLTGVVETYWYEE
ncbi:pilus assembly protein [Marinobacter sp.]|uniref:pilus assembly protein n=1 Tax=Marinobacter sp. TaxID=50741 RepID=UPI003561DD30